MRIIRDIEIEEEEDDVVINNNGEKNLEKIIEHDVNVEKMIECESSLKFLKRKKIKTLHSCDLSIFNNIGSGDIVEINSSGILFFLCFKNVVKNVV